MWMAAVPPLCMIPVMTDTTLAEENARLRARLAETEAALADAVEAQKRLESIVSELRREKFGPKSEKLDPEQFNLPLEDIEIAQGVLEAAQEKARDALKGKGAGRSGKTKRNRGHLPKHLPRIERVIEPETTRCPCGCGKMFPNALMSCRPSSVYSSPAVQNTPAGAALGRWSRPMLLNMSCPAVCRQRR